MGKNASKEFQNNAKLLPDDQADQYLREAEKIHHTIVSQYPFTESSEAPFCVVDVRKPDQPLIYVNKSFEWMTLYGLEEIIGRNCRFLQGRFTNPDTVKSIRDAIASGTSQHVELLNYRKDGLPFWNSFVLYPIFKKQGSTQLTHYFAIQQDVTFHNQSLKPLAAWSVDEVVFHLQCLQYPDPLLTQFYEKRINGEKLCNLNEEELEGLITSRRELSCQLGPIIQSLLSEIDSLKTDPDHFFLSHKAFRLRTIDLTKVKTQVWNDKESLQQFSTSSRISPPISTLIQGGSSAIDLLKNETICFKLNYFPQDFITEKEGQESLPVDDDDVFQKIFLVDRNATSEKIREIVCKLLDFQTPEIMFRQMFSSEVLSQEQISSLLKDPENISLDLVLQLPNKPHTDDAIQRRIANTIHLSLRIVSELEELDQLKFSLTSNSTQLLAQLKSLPSVSYHRIVKPLLRVLRTHGKSNEFVRLALKDEVKTAKDVDSLLGDGSLAALIFTEYHQIVAHRYLTWLLTPLVNRVIGSPENATIETLQQFYSEKKVRGVQESVKIILSSFLSELFRSAPNIPDELTNLYRLLYLECKSHFRQDKLDQVRNSKMIVFFFQKFLCPGLSNAHRYVQLPRSTTGSTATARSKSTGDTRDRQSTETPRTPIIMKEMSLIVEKICDNSKFPSTWWQSYFNQMISDSQLSLQIFISQVLLIPETHKQRTDDLSVLSAYLNADLLMS